MTISYALSEEEKNRINREFFDSFDLLEIHEPSVTQDLRRHRQVCVGNRETVHGASRAPRRHLRWKDDDLEEWRPLRGVVFLNARRGAESVVIKIEVIDVESDGFRDAKPPEGVDEESVAALEVGRDGVVDTLFLFRNQVCRV